MFIILFKNLRSMLKVLVTIISRDKEIKAQWLYDIDTGKVLILKWSNIREVRIDNYKFYDLRNRLIDSWKIKNLVFQEDIEFVNPNTAAWIVLWRNASWKERIKLEDWRPLSSILGKGIPIKDSVVKVKQGTSHKKQRLWWIRKYDAKRFCDESYNYLLSIKPETVTKEDLDFNWKWSFNKFGSLKDVLERMLISTQNYQSRPNIIKYRLDWSRKEKIDKLLFWLDAKKVLESYDSDSLCEVFQKELWINPWMVRKSWCKSVISSCKFINKFKSVNDFKSFIESYNKDIDSRVELIKYMQHNIHWFWFALSCDFIKEMWYTSFSKPDVHIKDVLLWLGLCNSTDNEIIFRCLNNLAGKWWFTPYKLDKILWMICSGKFYSSKSNIRAEIPRHKDEFIEYMKNI